MHFNSLMRLQFYPVRWGKRFFIHVCHFPTALSPSSAVTGPGTRLLTITGSNFGVSNQTASVGGLPCPLSGAPTSTTIICFLPFDSGVGKAVIVSVAGQVSTSSLTFRFFPLCSFLSLPSDHFLIATLRRQSHQFHQRLLQRLVLRS